MLVNARVAGGPLLAKHSSTMLLAHFILDAHSRQPHELSEGCVWPTRAAGQCGNETRQRCVSVAVNRAQVDCIDCSTSWAAHPQVQYRAAIAAPMIGENSIGIRLAWRSFQAPIRRSASSSTFTSVARRLAASFSAATRRRSSILRRLKPMEKSSPKRMGVNLSRRNSVSWAMDAAQAGAGFGYSVRRISFFLLRFPCTVQS